MWSATQSQQIVAASRHLHTSRHIEHNQHKLSKTRAQQDTRARHELSSTGARQELKRLDQGSKIYMLQNAPEMPRQNMSPMRLWATLVRPSCASWPSIARGLEEPGVPRNVAWKSMYSHTVAVPGSTSSCNAWLHVYWNIEENLQTHKNAPKTPNKHYSSPQHCARIHYMMKQDDTSPPKMSKAGESRIQGQRTHSRVLASMGISWDASRTWWT